MVTSAALRASAVGVFRWYRDAGFVVGALVAGGFADLVGFRMAYVIVGSISIASALFVAVRMASRQALPGGAMLPSDGITH